MFDNKWQKKEMPLVSLIGMGGGIASPAFLASIVLNILKPTVFSPVDDTGVPDFDYTAESSAITDVTTSSINLTGTSGSFIPGSYVKDANSTIIPSDIASVDGSTINFSSAVDLTSVTAPLEMVDASGNPIAPTTSNVTTTTSIPGSSVATNYTFTYPNGTSIGSPKLINSAANMYPGNSMPIGDRMLWIKSSDVSNNAISDSVALNGRTLFTDSSDESNLFSGGVEFGEGYTRLPYDIASLGTETGGGASYATEIATSPGLLDIVTWTGSGTLDHDRRIPHSLGSVPGMIIVKLINGNQDWYIYHSAKGVNSYQALNNGTAFTSGFNCWGSAPTETDFGINEDNLNTKDVNSEYVAYVFAEDTPGKIKCGTYTGNAGDNFINVGFQPNFVLIKEQNNSGYNWVAANTFTMTAQRYWHPGYGGGLLGSSNDYINNNSTSFHLKGSDSHFNQGGRSYLYLAVSGTDGNGGPLLSPDTTQLTFQDSTNLDQLTSGMTVTSDDPNQSITGTLASDADLSTNTVIVNATSWPTGDSVTGPAVTATASGFEENPTLTLTDTTVSKISDGSLIGGTTIDQVLTVGETVQADTATTSSVTASVFSTDLYTGTDSNLTITNGINLAAGGGIIWDKKIDTTSDYRIIDVQSNAILSTSLTTARLNGIFDIGDYITYDNDGWTSPNGNSGQNSNGDNHVAWTFRKAPGFFDIVTWNASDLTTGYKVNHNLGSQPGMIICKNINNGGASWHVYHKDATSSSSSDPNAHFFYLNQTREAIWSSGMSDPNSDFGGWDVTDTQFRASGSMGLDNGSDDFVAYLFAADTPGLIKCGSYTGAGGYSASAPETVTEVNVGFQPRWMMIKRADSSGNWVILDEDMDDHTYLKANSPDQQGGVIWNFTSTGVRLVGEWDSFNNSGGEYTYIAIAENPEADITTQSTASGTVSASSGNTITLSNTSGTWSTGTKVQGTDSDTKNNPDAIRIEDVSLTSSAPTAERNVNTWGDAVWELATDENFTQNVQTATTALSATGTQAGPSFTLDRETGYYTRTKYTALGQESEWSDVTYFVTRARYVDSFWINTFNHNGWNYEYTEDLDIDDDGNVYIVSIRYSAGGSGYKGMSLVKLDANGILQWQKYLTYHVPGDRTYPLESRTVSVTPDGSEIFVTAQGDLGMLVCNFNSDGNLQWTKKLGGVNSNNFSYGTTLTSSGELVMFGRDSQNSLGHTFLTQISNSGSQTFYSSIGRTSGDTTQLVYTCEPFVDTDDNIHFVINSWNGSKRTPGVVKYDSSGVLQSVSDFNSNVDNSIADEDEFGDIAVDGSGNKYITYRRDVTATHVSGMRSGLLKLNSSDEIQWQSDISSSNAHYPLQVNIDSSGDIVSAFQDRRTPNKGIIITKHTSDGTLVWKRSFRHTSKEVWTGAEVRLNRNDNIIINSFTQGGDTKGFTCQFPSDGSLTGNYIDTVGYYVWEDATHVTVSSSTAYFKNGSSIYSAKSTSMSMSSFSNTNTGDNILTVNKIDIPTP